MIRAALIVARSKASSLQKDAGRRAELRLGRHASSVAKEEKA